MGNRKFYCLLTCLALGIFTQAKFDYGLCPSAPTSHPNGLLNVTKLSGIWFEYLGTEGIKEDFIYDCASWLMMYDQPNDTVLSVVNSI